MFQCLYIISPSQAEKMMSLNSLMVLETATESLDRLWHGDKDKRQLSHFIPQQQEAESGL